MKKPPKPAAAKPTPRSIRAMLLRFAADRPEKTFCPSEVARALADDWRPLMPLIRTQAARLISQGQLRCTQGGKPCDPIKARGPIRFAASS